MIIKLINRILQECANLTFYGIGFLTIIYLFGTVRLTLEKDLKSFQMGIIYKDFAEEIDTKATMTVRKVDLENGK